MNAESVGQFFAHWRNLRSLSQAALGEMVGVKQTCISSWEKGHNDISRADFFGLVDALEIPEEDWQQALRLPRMPPSATSESEQNDGAA